MGGVCLVVRLSLHRHLLSTASVEYDRTVSVVTVLGGWLCVYSPFFCWMVFTLWSVTWVLCCFVLGF